MLLICESCHRHWHWRPCSITPQRRATCSRCHRQRVALAWERRRRASSLRRMIQERVSALGDAEVALDLEKLMADVEAASTRALQTARGVVQEILMARKDGGGMVCPVTNASGDPLTRAAAGCLPRKPKELEQ